MDMREKIARAFWNVNCPDETYDEALSGEYQAPIKFALEAADAILAELPGMVLDLEWQEEKNCLTAYSPALDLDYEIQRQSDGILRYRIGATRWMMPDHRDTVKLAAHLDTTHRAQVMKAFGLEVK